MRFALLFGFLLGAAAAGASATHQIQRSNRCIAILETALSAEIHHTPGVRPATLLDDYDRECGE